MTTEKSTPSFLSPHTGPSKSVPEELKHESCLEPKALTLSDLGSNIVEASYLIKGSVLHRAAELRQMQEKGHALPFPKFYPLHYGNPQLLGQPPITFLRQVIAATFCPSLLETEVFSEDVKRRVRYYLANIPGEAVGAYSEAEGFKVLRNSVAKYIEKRDGHPADANKIYMLDGALDGMVFVFRIIFSKPNNGVTPSCVTCIGAPAIPRISGLLLLRDPVKGQGGVLPAGRGRGRLDHQRIARFSLFVGSGHRGRLQRGQGARH